MNWIKITDRMPKETEVVLCLSKITIGAGDYSERVYCGYADDYASHWMPLPEPPKE